MPELPNYLAVVQALRRTPLPSNVAIFKLVDDLSLYKLTLAPTASGTAWRGEFYLIRKNGLPLFMPPSKKRRHFTRFTATFIADTDPLVNMLRIRTEAEKLTLCAKKRLERRRRKLKGLATEMRTRGYIKPGPGRPKGISWAMEKKGPRRELALKKAAGVTGPTT